ncbi:hypothetical protein [Mycolicibacterium sp.]|uniref:hypothetical protein n=1 Tax=Mycolicibacterium sp. TaxID=2320850 RepID=UPI00355D91A3
MNRITDLLKPERNRRWLYGVLEAILYACVGLGIIELEPALLLLTVPAAALGLARSNVRNEGPDTSPR